MSGLDDAAVARLRALAASVDEACLGPPRRGEVVGGRFELDEPIGEGGMGVVYRALDRETRAVVAVKLVRIASASEEARFEREAAAVARLSHPGVVRYVAHGTVVDGTDPAERFLATQLYTGRSLAERLCEGPLTVDDALTIGRRAAEALAAAHRAGIVHRDVKPSNLFLEGGDPDRVVLLDFGVARGRDAVSVTRTGTVVGTACYMAPEQVRSSRDVDARADVFALGLCLFECLAGRAAFEADSTEAALTKVLLEDAPHLGELRPELPLALGDLVRRMLDRRPERRPEDAGAVARELADLEARQPTLAAGGPPSLKHGRFAPGQIIADKYEIEGVLGEGGMGVVVAARHRALDKRVAIKLLRGVRGDDDARFLREAQAASRLEGDHVVQVIDFGTDRDAAPYMVMELLAGADLGQVLRDRGALPVGEAVDYLLQAAEAIAHAHAQGVVHRDIKPSNLFLTSRPDGSPLVKVLDFGISKLIHETEPLGWSTLTGAAAVLGSPRYMSPEQLKAARDVDARTDIWALGAVLSELVSGRPAFDAPTAVALAAAIASEPPSPLGPAIPAGLVAVIERCLRKAPRERFQSVGELSRALSRFAPGARRSGPLSTRRLWIAAGALGLGAMLLFASTPERQGELPAVAAASGSVASSPSRPEAPLPVTEPVIDVAALAPSSGEPRREAPPTAAAASTGHGAVRPPPRPPRSAPSASAAAVAPPAPAKPKATVDPRDPALEGR